MGCLRARALRIRADARCETVPLSVLCGTERSFRAHLLLKFDSRYSWRTVGSAYVYRAPDHANYLLCLFADWREGFSGRLAVSLRSIACLFWNRRSGCIVVFRVSERLAHSRMGISCIRPI